MRISSLQGLVAALAVVLLGSTLISAQSGRRLPKGSPPVASPTPREVPAQPKPPPKPDFILKVYSNIEFDATFGFPKPERMHTWTVERLRKTTLLDVRDAGEVNRRDAIKQAKSETDVYVVLLELRREPYSPYGPTSVQAMSIHLTVYHPVSGKIKFARTLALGQNSSRPPGSPDILQACNPGVYGNDLLLLEASTEAANSVMNVFNVPLPRDCRVPGLL